MATPSLARGSLATPFPFLSKCTDWTVERGGGHRTPFPFLSKTDANSDWTLVQ